MDWNRLNGAQQELLRLTIFDAFVSDADFDMFLGARLNKPPLATFVAGANFAQRIFKLLKYAQARGWTDKLVGALQTEAPDNTMVRELADSIRLAGARPAAQLNGETVGLEALVRDGDFSDIRLWSARMAQIGRSVCRVESPENSAVATGLLVEPDLVLTNYHAVESALGRGPVSEIRCRFDYARDVAAMNAGTAFALAKPPIWEAEKSSYDEAADQRGIGEAALDRLDYALIRLAKPLNDREPIALRAPSIAPKVGAPVFVVQHPQGAPMSLAIGWVCEKNGNGSRLRYNTNTLGGSSGSGVFDEKLELVALHHAGDPKSAVKAKFNQGIPIDLIVEDIASKRKILSSS